MSGYQPPSKDQLDQSIEPIKENYTKETNKKRVDDIKLLLFIHKNCSHEELIAACMFIHKKIEQEYHWSSPENSTLYCLMQNALKLSKTNLLDNVTQLTYLMKLYPIISAYPILKDITTSYTLLKEIDYVCCALIKKLQQAISTILNSPPSEKSLRENFSKLPDEYYKICRSNNTISAKFFFGGHEKERDNWCKFISVLDQENASSTLRYALLLHFMLQIEQQYYATSPKNSSFYCLCCRTLNIDHTKELSIASKSMHLAVLQQYVSSLLKDKTQINLQEKFGFLCFPKIYFENVHDLINDELHEFKYSTDHGIGSTRLNSYLNSLELCAAQYGVTLALTGSIHWAVSNISVSSMYYTLLPEYFVTIAVLLFLEKKYSLNVISMVSNQLAPIASNLVKMPLKVTYNSLAGLTHFASDLQASLNTMIDNTDFVTALYNAPDHIFPKKAKEKLQMIYDLPTKNNMSLQSNEEVIISISEETITANRNNHFTR